MLGADYQHAVSLPENIITGDWNCVIKALFQSFWHNIHQSPDKFLFDKNLNNGGLTQSDYTYWENLSKHLQITIYLCTIIFNDGIIQFWKHIKCYQTYLLTKKYLQKMLKKQIDFEYFYAALLMWLNWMRSTPNLTRLLHCFHFKKCTDFIKALLFLISTELFWLNFWPCFVS